MKNLLLILSFVFSLQLNAQTDQERLYNALSTGFQMESDLQELCDEIGGRVTGSKSNEYSVKWAIQKFKDAGLKPNKHEFKMPVLWMGGQSVFQVIGATIFSPLAVAKYQSPPGNYTGDLIDLGMGTVEEIEKVQGQLKGNFALVETELCLDINGLFAEYVQASAVEEALKNSGVKGIIFMASRPQKLLYRFITAKGADNDLPQFIMAREDAKRCLRTLRKGETLNFNAFLNAQTGDAFKSHNVLADIKGYEHPEEIILVGAHLDSWALGTGANDNGCNVTMLINIARQMKALNIKPKRTIRFALWNGEEQGYFGSWAYTKDYEPSLDKHKMAMSIDIGSGEIVGFFTNGRKDLTMQMENLLAPINQDSSLTMINVPIIGTDNFDFMLQGIPNLVAAHKPASYGINYHASSDTYDKVDFNSLRKNSQLIAHLLMRYANADAEEINIPRNTRAEIQQIFEDNETEFSMRMFNVWEPWITGARGIK